MCEGALGHLFPSLRLWPGIAVIQRFAQVRLELESWPPSYLSVCLGLFGPWPVFFSPLLVPLLVLLPGLALGAVWVLRGWPSGVILPSGLRCSGRAALLELVWTHEFFNSQASVTAWDSAQEMIWSERSYDQFSGLGRVLILL